MSRRMRDARIRFTQRRESGEPKLESIRDGEMF
jgi:hypothetical protein